MKSIGVFGVPMIIYAILQLATTGTKMVLTTTGTAMRADIVDYDMQEQVIIYQPLFPVYTTSSIS